MKYVSICLEMDKISQLCDIDIIITIYHIINDRPLKQMHDDIIREQ